MQRRPWYVLILCTIAGALCLTEIVSTCRAEEADIHQPLLAAARSTSIGDLKEPLEPGVGFHFTGSGDSWIGSFWAKHRWHFLTTFMMVETEYLYTREVGTSRSPLMLSDPPGIDSSTDKALYDADGSPNFVENNKTNLLHAIALGSILGSHEGSWGRTADDFMGLLEAEKFNTASNELVKRIVGRHRPSLDRADPGEMTQAEYDDIQASDAGHLSFYSAATSEAFTYCSYLDLLVANRLREHPRWRIVTGAGLYGFAAYIGYTRMRQGEHYLTDVLAGATAGTFVGRGFYKANHRDESSEDRFEKPADETGQGKSRIHFSPPMPVPGGGIISMTVELGR